MLIKINVNKSCSAVIASVIDNEATGEGLLSVAGSTAHAQATDADEQQEYGGNKSCDSYDIAVLK